MPPATERLDFRCQRQQKQAIQQAAQILGQTVSDFALSTLLEKAMAVVEKHSVLTLSQRDAKKFFEAVFTEDPPPNAALKRAARRFKEQSGGDSAAGRIQR